jgi:hypothetical protein
MRKESRGSTNRLALLGKLRILLLFCLGAVTPVYAVPLVDLGSSCSTCNTVAQFRDRAVDFATIKGKVGVYQASSTQNARTALVTVTGTPRQFCLGQTCGWTLDNAHGVVRFQNGQPIVNDLDLNTLDVATFVSDRRKPLKITVPSDYSSSIINSSDEEVGPGISFAFISKGINPGLLEAGTMVLAKFQDGTSALFMKTSGMSTEQWAWTGMAWDAQGNRIDRHGAHLNATPSGSLSGGGSFTNVSGSEHHGLYMIGSWSGVCATSTTVTIDGESAGTYHGFISC